MINHASRATSFLFCLNIWRLKLLISAGASSCLNGVFPALNTSSSTLESDSISNLQLTSFGLIRSYADTSSSPSASQNLNEKIVQRYALGLPVGKFVCSGDYVSIKAHH